MVIHALLCKCFWCYVMQYSVVVWLLLALIQEFVKMHSCGLFAYFLYAVSWILLGLSECQRLSSVACKDQSARYYFVSFICLRLCCAFETHVIIRLSRFHLVLWLLFSMALELCVVVFGIWSIAAILECGQCLVIDLKYIFIVHSIYIDSFLFDKEVTKFQTYLCF